VKHGFASNLVSRKAREMSQAETGQLIRIVCSAALSRVVCSVVELGVADRIKPGSPQGVKSLGGATGTHERSLYRILRFLASKEIFQGKGRREFDHTSLLQCLRGDAEAFWRQRDKQNGYYV
jgi:hypothetical protein